MPFPSSVVLDVGPPVAPLTAGPLLGSIVDGRYTSILFHSCYGTFIRTVWDWTTTPTRPTPPQCYHLTATQHSHTLHLHTTPGTLYTPPPFAHHRYLRCPVITATTITRCGWFPAHTTCTVRCPMHNIPHIRCILAEHTRTARPTPCLTPYPTSDAAVPHIPHLAPRPCHHWVVAVRWLLDVGIAADVVPFTVAFMPRHTSARPVGAWCGADANTTPHLTPRRLYPMPRFEQTFHLAPRSLALQRSCSAVRWCWTGPRYRRFVQPGCAAHALDSHPLPRSDIAFTHPLAPLFYGLLSPTFCTMQFIHQLVYSFHAQVPGLPVGGIGPLLQFP